VSAAQIAEVGAFLGRVLTSSSVLDVCLRRPIMSFTHAWRRRTSRRPAGTFEGKRIVSNCRVAGLYVELSSSPNIE
jgi:hypothetical protein